MGGAHVSTKRPLRFDDLLTQTRASRPRVTPDGAWVFFVGTRPDPDQNRNVSHLYRVPLDGGKAVQITRHGTSNGDHEISPDGKWVAFTSNRSGISQVWVLPVDGGEARQVTTLKLGARRPAWFPDGKRFLAISAVYRDTGDQEEIARREEAREKEKPGYRVIDRLMFRHWDAWTDDKVDHLFAVEVESGKAQDLTPGPYPVPPLSLTGDPDYAVSPDGSEICFVSLREDALATSTNTNLWTIPASGGEPKRISPWDGCNAFPAYSPDGSRIAYLGMRRAGYEADKRELVILDRKTGKITEVAPGLRGSAGVPVWSPDGERIHFAAQDEGRMRVYAVDADGGEPVELTGHATDHDPAVSPDGEWLVFARETLNAPPEIWRVPSGGGKDEALTRLNAENLAGLEMNEAEDFWFEGAKGARVHGMIVMPPRFETGKKYPTVFLIHGGPQGMFGLDFHERWNVQLFAAQGYVTVMMNPRGSTGYGQEFVDAIRGEWGGACYEDLRRGFDHVLATFDYCDPGRTAAAGASFGGFMVNWIAGQTDRFRCLVSHDGIMNTEMMDWATDELWFTEWEFGGAPWEAPEEYRKWSPHLNVENMKSPMLVIQGEQDFRCPVSEGLDLFTALQRRGVPSRLLYFEDEGHWVLKPKNRRVWWETVLGWLEKYLKD
jgi:dipeptidyl aminopeptidase/acylaminoacyl peptidase